MTDTTAPPLDLTEVEARIDRHAGKEPNPRIGDPRFVDLCRLVDHDAPALLETVLTVLPALDRLVDAAEDLLTELEKHQTEAALSGAEQPAWSRLAGKVRIAILAVPAGLPEVLGEAS